MAILPRIVREDELLSANSALWVGETIADIVGYPLAALFVVALGDALPVAFWLDAATYLGIRGPAELHRDPCRAGDRLRVGDDR